MNKQFFTILFTALFAGLPLVANNELSYIAQAKELAGKARNAVVSRIKATPKALKEAATFCKKNPADAAKAAFVVGLIGTVAYAARRSYLKNEHKQPAHNTIATQTPVIQTPVAQAPTVQPSTVQTPVVKAAAVKTSVVKRAVKSVKAKVAKKRNQRRAKRNAKNVKRNNVKRTNGRKINRRK